MKIEENMKRETTLLVVDDDAAHRTMLKTLLGGWGYKIFEADDGVTALEEVREKAFDLILMDIRKVKISGFEALSEINAIKPAPGGTNPVLKPVLRWPSCPDHVPTGEDQLIRPAIIT